VNQRWISTGIARGDDYDARFRAMEQSGHDVHGEAAFVEQLGPATVFDAGCGTGRVAIELARRNIDVVGVDVDPVMLDAARAKAPELDWRLGDLANITVDRADADTPRQFDVVLLAGNVMIFLRPGTEAAVVANLARHVAGRGVLVAGFQLLPGRLDLARYDQCTEQAGLELDSRFATWDRAPWAPGGDYAVSVHRHRQSSLANG
jgi:SAM-dependent methyltransferase